MVNAVPGKNGKKSMGDVFIPHGCSLLEEAPPINANRLCLIITHSVRSPRYDKPHRMHTNKEHNHRIANQYQRHQRLCY